MNELWLSGAVLFGLVAGVLLEKLDARRRRKRQVFEVLALSGGYLRVTCRGPGGLFIQRVMDAAETTALLTAITEAMG